jgi:predicted RND superfamily exporter protein
LTRDGQKAYEAFKSVVDERRVLAVKLELPADVVMDDSLYQGARQVLATLKSRYPGEDFAWMDFYDIYARAIGSQDYVAVAAFAEKNPGLVMPILGAHHAGFLLMISQSVGDSVITSLMRDILTAPWPKPFAIYPGGLPYVNVKLNEYADDIKLTLIPLMVVVSVLMTFWLTRSWRASALLVIPSVFSLAQSLTITKFAYGSLTMVSAVVPLMMFVINLMICFHLYYAAMAAQGFDKAWSIKKIPLTLSVLTMAVGFAANLVSEIPVIRQFAVVSTWSVLATAVMSTLGMRLLLPVLVPSLKAKNPRMFDPLKFRWVMPGRWILATSAAIVLLFALALPRLELLTDATRYFPAASGLREAIKRVEKDFLGTPAFEILVRKTQSGAMTYDDQKTLHELEASMAQSMGGRYKILSLGRLLTEANRLFSGIDTFPPQRITWTMLQGGLPETVRSAFPVGEVYRISLLGSAMNSDQFQSELKILKTMIPRFSEQGYALEFGGINYHLMMAQEALVRVMAEGFLLTLGLVTLLFMATFRDVRILGRFLLASLLPMAIGVITIYVAGFSLNIATVMTFSIALGMIVDNSFHLTWNITRGRSYQDYYADTIVPIFGSGIILGMGFALFALNGFLPIRQVGLLVAVMLVAGIAASLFMLPERK